MALLVSTAVANVTNEVMTSSGDMGATNLHVQRPSTFDLLVRLFVSLIRLVSTFSTMRARALSKHHISKDEDKHIQHYCIIKIIY